jgi:penicillin amidase
MELHSYSSSYHAAGVVFPGMPGIAMGRTNETAWSITNSKIDNADWYLEKIRKDRYLHGGEWKKMHRRTEFIKVKGRADSVKFPVYSTNHGLDIQCPVF